MSECKLCGKQTDNVYLECMNPRLKGLGFEYYSCGDCHNELILRRDGKWKEEEKGK